MNVASSSASSAASVSSTRAATAAAVSSSERKLKGQPPFVFESSRHPADREDFEATGNETYVSGKGKKANGGHDDAVASCSKNSTSPKQSGKRDDGWREVVRK